MLFKSSFLKVEKSTSTEYPTDILRKELAHDELRLFNRDTLYELGDLAKQGRVEDSVWYDNKELFKEWSSKPRDAYQDDFFNNLTRKILFSVDLPRLVFATSDTTLSSEDKVIMDSLTADMKRRYLVEDGTVPVEFYASRTLDDDDKTVFPMPVLQGIRRLPATIPDITHGTCIRASLFCKVINAVEENARSVLLRFFNEFPYPNMGDGNQLSRMVRETNKRLLFFNMGYGMSPIQVDPKLTIVGTPEELESVTNLLKDLRLAGMKSTEFKERKIKSKDFEEKVANENLMNLFTGTTDESTFNKGRYYGVSMYFAWMAALGVKLNEDIMNIKIMQHWEAVSKLAGDAGDAINLKLLKSKFKCFGVAESPAGLVAITSAGFFTLDDLDKPTMAKFLTLDELAGMLSLDTYDLYATKVGGQLSAYANYLSYPILKVKYLKAIPSICRIDYIANHLPRDWEKTFGKKTAAVVKTTGGFMSKLWLADGWYDNRAEKNPEFYTNITNKVFAGTPYFIKDSYVQDFYCDNTGYSIDNPVVLPQVSYLQYLMIALFDYKCHLYKELSFGKDEFNGTLNDYLQDGVEKRNFFGAFCIKEQKKDALKSLLACREYPASIDNMHDTDMVHISLPIGFGEYYDSCAYTKIPVENRVVPS